MSGARALAATAHARWRALSPDARAVLAALTGLLMALAAKVLLARWLLLGGPGTLAGIASDLVATGLLISPGLLLWRRRGGRWLLLGLAAAAGAAMLGTLVYARYFNDVVSLGATRMFTHATSGAPSGGGLSAALSGDLLTVRQYAENLGGSVRDLLFVTDLAFFIDLPVFGWLLLRRGALEPPTQRRRRWWQAATVVAVGAVMLTGAITLVAHAPGILGSKATSRTHGVVAYGIGSYFHRPRLDLGFAVDVSDPASVSAAIERLRGSTDGARATVVPTGAAAGSNVIVIQVEALQTLLIDAELEGAELTPSLNELVAESWYFPNTFSQLGGGGTSDAEFIANTSLYPAAVEPSSIRWAGRELPSLPRVLGEAGYHTITMHPNDASYWNRRELYAALGFERYYDRAYFGEDDVVGFGASDEVLYDGALALMEEQQAAGVPFYAHVVSITAHHPFVGMPAEWSPLELSAAYDGTTLGAYATYQAYADRELGEFVAELKRTGLWDESVVVVYGDHFGLADLEPDGAEAAALESLLGHGYTIADRLRVPLIVHLPGQTGGEVVTTPTAVMDVMPTVLDVLGLRARTPMFGRSVFAGGPTVVAMRRYVEAGAYVRDDVLVVPDDGRRAAVALPLDDPTAVRDATSAEVAGIEVAVDLIMLSDAWADALPRRAGAGER